MNLLLNSLGENIRGEWIFKDKNTGGERARLVKHFLISIVEQEEVSVVSRKNMDGGIKYKLNESQERIRNLESKKEC